MEDIADLVERFELKPPSIIVVVGVVNVIVGEDYGGEDNEMVRE